MKDLHISSLPMLNVLQEACEIFVIHNHVEMAIEYNAQTRNELRSKADMAANLVEQLRNIIANNNADV